MIALAVIMLGITTFATLCVAVLAAAPTAAHATRSRKPHPAKALRNQMPAYRAANDNGERKRRRAF